MSTNGAQETLTASTGSGNATGDGDFMERAYEYGVIVQSSIKSFLRWSLVCEEAARKEQTQLEKIIGDLGHDPTAPSDLYTVTDTVMFDSATIMATLIITFCVFYFIDFFLQIFGGFSVLGAADVSPSLASIQPIIPLRTRKRKKSSGSSMSRESIVPNLPSATASRVDSTQSSTSSTGIPMKDILTKSFRTSLSKETITPPPIPPPKEPKQQSMVSESEVSAEIYPTKKESTKEKGAKNSSAPGSSENVSSKSNVTSKALSSRKVAGRSPITVANVNGIELLDLRSKRADTCSEQTFHLDRDFSTYPPIITGRGLVINEDKQTQTTDEDFLADYNQSNNDTRSSVEGYYHYSPGKGYKRRTRDYIYDEDHKLEYADDLSGDEFDSYEHEKALAYLEYEAQLDGLRTEFSIDDVADPDRLLDEWENVEYSPTLLPPRNPLLMFSRDDDLESLYSKAEEIYKRINVQGQENSQLEILKTMGSRIKAHGVEEEQVISELSTAVQQPMSPGHNAVASPKSKSGPISSPKYHEEGDGGTRLDKIAGNNVGDESLESETFIPHELGLTKEGLMDCDWEEPRSLQLSNSMDYGRHESFLAQGDDVALFERDDKTAKSISLYSVRQSVELRRFHHVLFTYPDSSASKVLLTGSFFGWKMSLPMHREGKVFRLSITLPAGRHEYRFQVYRHCEKAKIALTIACLFALFDLDSIHEEDKLPSSLLRKAEKLEKPLEKENCAGSVVDLLAVASEISPILTDEDIRCG
ncbi:hypothetical protein RB195_003592 [Necator americanus]|uniref:AMP-activated protein kinase glycogen-binding domain-containing protein n=1 Tax=Necator americanus TaxID=51031 RepID=A0ABR1DPB7_NECAM